MAVITEYIQPLLQGESLSFEQATSLLDIIFEGEVPEVQIAAFLTAMRAKGATAPELAGLAKSLRDHAVSVKVDIDNLVDTCGTGGAAIKTCNISTASAIVAAGAGVYVAKHGNRGITSKCGSADVLEELGVKIDASADVVADCIREAHIGFMFAPMFHPAMKYVQPIRKSLGFRTVFNILGPLANPARANAQVLGVGDEALMEQIAEVLKLLGSRFAMVVHSNGLDEISTVSVTKILELKDGEIVRKELNAADFGFAPPDIEQLKVADAKTSAKVIRDILSGKDKGPRKDIVVLNAAAAIIAGNLADDFKSAIGLAEASVSEGGASDCLEKLIKVSNSGS
ncbi:MAG: anthranilate phosphoribosyltransferase [Phycisphaerae bacterium]|nr:anthranilate phosphoribosyltransferase [Phycisphaerae bacterium]NIP51640.1 anthranilate phosphoribosyltransferase [Phycisphaerae bacterium]NIS50830.1 anthranilate phosphoribosyltransferase [Phycisphaerae bacterium]NIU08548.1 anthranilate phosphoribosyltransferase [Phycisphaerae bacterium]NIU56068.1 anthranilate phosphoribosyltransferase [Phycisphaerae bacterium]